MSQRTKRERQLLCDKLVELRLLTPEQVAEAQSVVGSGSRSLLTDYFQRQGWLTSFQLKKLERGDTDGYFLGPHKVQYQISAGTFARVFRAVTPDGQAVAIKALRNRHTSEQANVDQFYREAMLTRSLNHPNITRTIEVGVDRIAGQPYIVMEFIEGGNLREFLKIRRKFEPPEMVRLAEEMVEGLRYALLRKVTHRDIKPTNILMSSTGHIKWVDFGLSGVSDQSPGAKLPVSAQRTVEYAALETATGAPEGDPRSDIFFLGIVWYEMISGRMPIPRSRELTGADRRAHMRNITPLAQDRSVPPELAQIIDQMTKFRPQERYQDYDSIIADLKRLPFAPTIPAPPVQGYQRDPHIRVVLVHRSQTVQEKIRKSLSKRGIQVVLTSDLRRAITIDQLNPFDCMIVDLKTVGMDGIETFTSYRNRGNKRQRAIFLTDDEPKTQRNAPENVVFLSKRGLTPAIIYDAIQKAVESKPA